MENRICKHCNFSKPLEEFSKHWKAKDGYSRVCLLCREIIDIKANKRRSNILLNHSVSKVTRNKMSKSLRLLKKTPPNKNKTLEEIHGIEKASQIKEVMSFKATGRAGNHTTPHTLKSKALISKNRSGKGLGPKEPTSNTKKTAIIGQDGEYLHRNKEWLKTQLEKGFSRKDIGKLAGVSEGVIAVMIGRKFNLVGLGKGRQKTSSKKGKTWDEFYGEEKAEEMKNLIRDSNFERIKNNELPYFNSKPELAVKALLEKYKLNFIPQFVVYASGKEKKYKTRIYDFGLPDHNLLIEVDGIYWHGKVKGKNGFNSTQLAVKIKDKYKNKLAKQEGYKLIRVWEDKKNSTTELDKFEQYIIDNLLLKEYQLTFKPSKEVRVEELYKEVM